MDDNGTERRPKRDFYRDPFVVGGAILLAIALIVGISVSNVSSTGGVYVPAYSSGH